MPVPIIAAAAAAAAARLAAKKVGQAAGKQVVKATLGKKSAAKYAAQKAAENAKTVAASSRNAKKSAETRAALKSAKSKPPLATPKSNVQTKPARKQVGNPPNLARAEGRQIDSVARGGGVKGPLGKARDRRVFTSKNPTGSGNASKPLESKLKPKTTVPKAKVITPLTSKMPARKPIANPANPPRGTVRINSGSNRPAMLRKRAVRATPKKK